MAVAVAAQTNPHQVVRTIGNITYGPGVCGITLQCKQSNTTTTLGILKEEPAGTCQSNACNAGANMATCYAQTYQCNLVDPLSTGCALLNAGCSCPDYCLTGPVCTRRRSTYSVNLITSGFGNVQKVVNGSTQTTAVPFNPYTITSKGNFSTLAWIGTTTTGSCRRVMNETVQFNGTTYSRREQFDATIRVSQIIAPGGTVRTLNTNRPPCFAFPNGTCGPTKSCVVQTYTGYRTVIAAWPTNLTAVAQLVPAGDICCPRGWSGDSCEIPVGCTLSGCDHNGTCITTGRNGTLPASETYCDPSSCGEWTGAFCHIKPSRSVDAVFIGNTTLTASRRLLAEGSCSLKYANLTYSLVSDLVKTPERVCDCGINWNARVPPSQDLVPQVNIRNFVLTMANESYTVMQIGNYNRTANASTLHAHLLAPVGFHPLDVSSQPAWSRTVGSHAEARYLCYLDHGCDGYYFMPLRNTSLAMGRVAFFTRTLPAFRTFQEHIRSKSIPTADVLDTSHQAIVVYSVVRVVDTQCADSRLDAATYCNRYPKACSLMASHTVGNLDLGPDMTIAATVHWRLYGHRQPLTFKPNSRCNAIVRLSEQQQRCSEPITCDTAIEYKDSYTYDHLNYTTVTNTTCANQTLLVTNATFASGTKDTFVAASNTHIYTPIPLFRTNVTTMANGTCPSNYTASSQVSTSHEDILAYTGLTNSLCGNTSLVNASRVWGTFAKNASTGRVDASSRCACLPPFASSDDKYTDCAGTRQCRAGRVNATAMRGSMVATPDMCVCPPLWHTDPSTCIGDVCNWCEANACPRVTGSTIDPFMNISMGCSCTTLFTGFFCNISKCHVNNSIPFDYSDGATKIACDCKPGFDGTYCETACSDTGGEYNSNIKKCECAKGYKGDACDIPVCDLERSSFNVDTGKCDCVSPWFGDECKEHTCDSDFGAKVFSLSVDWTQRNMSFGQPVRRVNASGWDCECNWPFEPELTSTGLNLRDNCRAFACGLGVPSLYWASQSPEYRALPANAHAACKCFDSNVTIISDNCHGPSKKDCPQPCQNGFCGMSKDEITAVGGPVYVSGINCCRCPIGGTYYQPVDSNGCQTQCGIVQPCLKTSTSSFKYNENYNSSREWDMNNRQYVCVCNDGYSSLYPDVSTCDIHTLPNTTTATILNSTTVPKLNMSDSPRAPTSSVTNNVVSSESTGLLSSDAKLAMGVASGAALVLVFIGAIFSTPAAAMTGAATAASTRGKGKLRSPEKARLLCILIVAVGLPTAIADVGSTAQIFFPPSHLVRDWQPGMARSTVVPPIFINLGGAVVDTDSTKVVAWSTYGDHGEGYTGPALKFYPDSTLAVFIPWESYTTTPFKCAAGQSTVRVGGAKGVSIPCSQVRWIHWVGYTGQPYNGNMLDLCDAMHYCSKAGVCVPTDVDATPTQDLNRVYYDGSYKTPFKLATVCECNDGRTGQYCERMCESKDVCNGHGSCTSGTSSVTDKRGHWSGWNSQTNPNYGRTCLCLDAQGKSACKCDAGYYGHQCEYAEQSSVTEVVHFGVCRPWQHTDFTPLVTWNTQAVCTPDYARSFSYGGDCPIYANPPVVDGPTTYKIAGAEGDAYGTHRDAPLVCGEASFDKQLSPSGRGVCWGGRGMGNAKDTAFCWCNTPAADIRDDGTPHNYSTGGERKGWTGTNCQTRTCTIKAEWRTPTSVLGQYDKTQWSSRYRCFGRGNKAYNYDSELCIDGSSIYNDVTKTWGRVNTEGECKGCDDGWGGFEGLSVRDLEVSEFAADIHGLCQSRTLHSMGGAPCGGYGTVTDSDTVQMYDAQRRNAMTVVRIKGCRCPQGTIQYIVNGTDTGICRRTCAEDASVTTFINGLFIKDGQYVAPPTLTDAWNASSQGCGGLNRGMCRPIVDGKNNDGFNSACMCDEGWNGPRCDVKDESMWFKGKVCGDYGGSYIPVGNDTHYAKYPDVDYFVNHIVPLQGADLLRNDTYSPYVCECNPDYKNKSYTVRTDGKYRMCHRGCNSTELLSNGISCGGHGDCIDDPNGLDKMCRCHRGWGGTNCANRLLVDLLGRECGGSDRGIIVYTNPERTNQNCSCVEGYGWNPGPGKYKDLCYKPCPTNNPKLVCSNAGSCGIDNTTRNDGVCQCHAGFVGKDCSINIAPGTVRNGNVDVCTNRGVPDPLGNWCICNPGYIGYACEIDVVNRQCESGQTVFDSLENGVVLTTATKHEAIEAVIVPRKNGFFSPARYLMLNPGVANNGTDAVYHFKTVGCKAGLRIGLHTGATGVMDIRELIITTNGFDRAYPSVYASTLAIIIDSLGLSPATWCHHWNPSVEVYVI